MAQATITFKDVSVGEKEKGGVEYDIETKDIGDLETLTPALYMAFLVKYVIDNEYEAEYLEEFLAHLESMKAA